jgi:SAM-dependent methyltransferase
MSPNSQGRKLGEGLLAGSYHYRAFVGPPRYHDLVGAMQFNLLTFLGLREHHFLLDIGCGSLRGGKLFIPYLLPGRYFGIEPERWLIEEGMRNELGEDVLRIKQPTFSNDNNFTLSTFDRKFDFILAQSIFSHASQQQIRRCLSEAKEVMKPTCIFAATFVEGKENYVGDEWVYPSCVTYSLELLIGLAKDQGLVCKPIDWPHPNQQTWILIVHPESEQNIPDVSDVAELSCLRDQLRSCKERLAKMERHPYVRLGLETRSLLQRLTRGVRRSYGDHSRSSWQPKRKHRRS